LQEQDDRQDMAPVPGLWEVDVPEAPPFSDVKPQELVMPNSTHIFVCPTCSGSGQVECTTCGGKGTVERQRRARPAPVEEAQESLPEPPCPTCHTYGEEQCPDCAGNGNLVEEQVFTWSRRARLWQNTDDIEELPRLALEQRARPVCKALINPYQGYWHSVAPLNELLQAAIDQVQDPNTHIIAAELQISGVPITEIDYQLNEKAQRLYLIGHDNEVVGNWSLLNPDRIALVGLGAAIVLSLAIFVLVVFLL
jgi:hypothetical protein